jgi:hypothetical protein
MHFGMQVDWPTSTSVVNAGLTDAFRELRPDEIGDPGFTWTPGYPAPTVTPDEVQDRIDFVYYAGHGVVPTIAQTLGYNANDGSTDIAARICTMGIAATTAHNAINATIPNPFRKNQPEARIGCLNTCGHRGTGGKQGSGGSSSLSQR